MRTSRFTSLLHRQDGFGLVEVVVSAFVLMLVTMGTLSLIDGSEGITVKTKNRTVAAGLAEQEQENLRATNVNSIGGDISGGRTGGYTRTATQTVDGVPYTVTSTVDWLRDKQGSTPTCTDDGVAEYLRLTTTVQGKNGNDGLAPVTQVSLLTPKAGAFGDSTGTLAVQVFDRSGTAPVQGLTVNVTGPQSGSAVTNSAGCALFLYYPSGDYTATYTRTGYVDTQGNASGTLTGRITDGSLSLIQGQYDQAASIQATIKASDGSISQAPGFTLANSAISNATGSYTYAATPVALGSTFTASGLFPFKDGYTGYSGTCAANDPTLYGKPGQSTVINPGDANRAFPLNQPLVTLTFRRPGSGSAATTNIKNWTVKAMQTDTGCSTLSYAFPKTDNNGQTKLGLPYGTYRVCVQDSLLKFQAFTLVNNGATNPTLVLDNPLVLVPTPLLTAWCS